MIRILAALVIVAALVTGIAASNAASNSVTHNSIANASDNTGSNSSILIAPGAQQTNTAEVRVINALAGIGPVDVYLDARRVAVALPTETASIYFTVREGRHSVAVRLPDANPLSAPVADVIVDLAANNSQSVVVYQKQFATSSYTPPVEQSGAALVLQDNRTPTQLGKTRLTAVHVAMTSPDRISVAYPSRASLMHEIGLEQPYGTIDVDAQEYNLVLVDAESSDLPILSRTQLSFYGSTLYTLIIVPDIGPSQQIGAGSSTPRMFTVSAPVDPPQNGIRLRVVHAAHNTQVVDVYIDERLVAQRVNYSRFTEYLGLADYSHRIALRRYGDSPDAEPLALAEFTITEENQSQLNWTLLLLNATEGNSAALSLIRPQGVGDSPIINTSGGEMIMVLVPDNISQTRLNFARVRLLHAVEGAAELRLLAPAFPPPPLPPGVTPTAMPQVAASPTPAPPVTLVEPVVFGSDANEQEVPAGFYLQLEVVAGQSLEVETLSSEELISGLVYTFVVIGNPLGDPPIQVLRFADYGRGLPPSRLYLGLIDAPRAPFANIRRLPTVNTAVLTTLPNGTEVEVLGRNVTGEWVRIKFADAETGAAREGWVSTDLIDVTRLGVPYPVLSLPVTSGSTQ
jgi:hypothetical protein